MGQVILYLDPWAGVSGDMLLAALLDLDRDGGELETELRSAVASLLGPEEPFVEITRDVEWGLSCTRVQVRSQTATPLRHLKDMERLIAKAALPDKVRTAAHEAVRRLANVEAAIHSRTVEEIHFHEVGAVDTLVDIVGTLVLVEALGVDAVMVGTIPVGGGTVEIAHGRMGVPAPATLRLLEGYAVTAGPEMVEATTPTGALLVGQLGALQRPLPTMTIERVGYGAGSLRLEGGPNVLRVMVGTAWEERDPEMPSAERRAGTPGGTEEAQPEADVMVELQANLDDVSPEVAAHAMAGLREAGAADVWSMPVQMKKGRPGVVVHALVAPDREEAAAAVLFRETGTLGVRRYEVARRLATRGTVTVEVGGVEVRVKWGRWRSRLISVAAEYDDAAQAARVTGLPVKDIMHLAVQAARELVVGTGTGHPDEHPCRAEIRWKGDDERS